MILSLFLFIPFPQFIASLKLKNIVVLSGNALDESFQQFITNQSINLVYLSSSSINTPAPLNIPVSSSSSAVSVVKEASATAAAFNKELASSLNENLPDLENLNEEMITNCLKYLLCSSNYPLLLVSKSGRSLISVIVGCLRRLQKWSFYSIFEEYRRYNNSNLRIQIYHEQFIELFDLETIEFPLNKEEIANFILKYREQ
jgi:protein tyrosine/serine phosphatase